MITTDKTRRAIEAIKTEKLDNFHGSLPDYLIECLETLQTPPTASDAHFIKAELAFIMKEPNQAIRIGEMEECIDDWCSVASIEIDSTPANTIIPIISGADAIDKGLIEFEGKLKDWHLNVSLGLALAGVLSYLIWG